MTPRFHCWPAIRRLSAILLVSCCRLTAAGAAAFVDPLDAPALSVTAEIAVRAPFNALAHAGHRLVAAGWRGLIVYSDDGGQHWQQATVPVSVDLTALSFPSERQGWAVGHSGVVLHTEDGGASWQRQIDGRGLAAVMAGFYKARVAAGDAAAAKWVDEAELSWRNGPEQPWLAVHFIDEQQGWIAGAFNLVARTHDGGKTWQPLLDRTHNPDGLHLNAIVQVGRALYLPSEGGTVFRMNLDSGEFERIKTAYAGTFFGACARDGQVLLYGLRGVAYLGQADGSGWAPVETGVKTALNGCADGAGKSILVTQGGEVVALTGAAATARRQPGPAMGPLFDVAGDGTGGWIFAGYKGLKRMTASGQFQ